MIKRLFICLSVNLLLFCFITSCKNDSPSNNKTSTNDKVEVYHKKDNVVIRDNKSEENKTSSDSNNSEEEQVDDDAQSEVNKDEYPSTNKVYDIAEQLPEFPGGLDELAKYIYNETSQLDLANTIDKSFRAMISFIVELDGTLSNVAVAKSSGNKSFDNSALDIVRHMPAWNPAVNDGKKVRMKYLVPVTIKPVH